MEDNSNSQGRSFKETRLREVLSLYYSREDVRKELFRFSKNRECIPRYGVGFGKRPDDFQYEGDIMEHVRRGATSFHCSEELWFDPLEISTDFSVEDYNELRVGWDLLLDIDSPYLEYSKTYTKLIIETLKSHGIDNVGVKFSGSKGFHIIVPWSAFPKELYGQKTEHMFPQWPRIICMYLTEVIQQKLSDKLFADVSLSDVAKRLGKKEEDLVITECLSCNRPAIKKSLVTWSCSSCNQLGDIVRIEKTRRIPKCPECRHELIEKTRREIFACEFCEINSDKDAELFGRTREKTEMLIEADLILVAPRHLFRMPYSLHEKTALASIVIDKDKVMDFQIMDANPLKVEIKNFYPEARPNEAKELLLKAIDWQEQKTKAETMREQYFEKRKPNSIETEIITDKTRRVTNNKKGEYKKVEIPNPDPIIFPPCIKHILKGVGDDGRKRALFVLISFFMSLGLSQEELERRINVWNELNYKPLKVGYIRSQLSWYKKNGPRLPPNCDKTNYKDLNACSPDALCKQIKNPVNYAVKKFFSTMS